jgi:UDP-glucose 4-epimerase
MAPTVLITGACGNIGTKLRRHFAAMDWNLRLLDADPHGDPAVVAADLAVWDDRWVSQFDRVDAVIHLAADGNSAASWARVRDLNLDLPLNVYEAAARQGAKRLVFASSNWVMAGHRFEPGTLTTDLDPAPVNPYGASKLFGERLGRSYHDRWGLSVICFRIGYLQAGDNTPGQHMGWNDWGQQMWLSNRDLCQAMERAVLAEGVGFAVLNLMSDNPGMRWDIETTRRTIGYAPRDGHATELTAAMQDAAQTARITRELADRLDALDADRRW